jgi:hypothetical protein
MSGAPPPGWYPDPWQAAASRWWDGEQWTAHVAPGEGAAGAAAPVAATPIRHSGRTVVTPADATVAVGREAAVALWVRWAVLLPPLLGLVSVSSTAHALRSVLDSVETDSTAATSNGAALGSQLAGMVALVTTVGQMLWLHRAVAGARVLGLRGRRSPGWAAAGWIIPIVNYWWPYQDVGSMFPEGERPTRQLRGWWALHVLSLPLLVIAVVGVVAGGPLVLWAPLAVLPPIGAAVLMRELIDRVLATHRAGAAALAPRDTPAAPTGRE